MKRIVFVLLMFSSFVSFSQFKNLDLESSKSTLGIRKPKFFEKTKAHIYTLFPQIENYKGFVFSEFLYCEKVHPYAAVGVLYRNRRQRQEMKIVIHDFNDSIFGTNLGEHLKDIRLYMITSEAEKIGARKSENVKLFDKNIVGSERFANYHKKTDYVYFYGYNKSRYLIEILIMDKKNIFNKPEKIEDFIVDYLNLVKI